jgi:phosphatidate cytidylyltransferase
MNRTEIFNKLKSLLSNNNMTIRCASGLAIGLVFILTIFAIRPLFYVLFYIIAALMMLEWHNMTSTAKNYKWLGQIIIPLPIAAILLLSYIDTKGWLLFTFFAIIWTVDSMAMVGGNFFRGPKLAPKLSPKKTISGLATGVLSAVIITNLVALTPYFSMPYGILESKLELSIFALIIAFIAQMSDLFISFFKRKFNIKDSGTIIPGHGGVLDRFDSIILTAPIVFFYCAFYA